jgi:hypothetical protein
VQCHSIFSFKWNLISTKNQFILSNHTLIIIDSLQHHARNPSQILTYELPCLPLVRNISTGDYCQLHTGYYHWTHLCFQINHFDSSELVWLCQLFDNSTTLRISHEVKICQLHYTVIVNVSYFINRLNGSRLVIWFRLW